MRNAPVRPNRPDGVEPLANEKINARSHRPLSRLSHLATGRGHARSNAGGQASRGSAGGQANRGGPTHGRGRRPEPRRGRSPLPLPPSSPPHQHRHEQKLVELAAPLPRSSSRPSESRRSCASSSSSYTREESSRDARERANRLLLLPPAAGASSSNSSPFVNVEQKRLHQRTPGELPIRFHLRSEPPPPWT